MSGEGHIKEEEKNAYIGNIWGWKFSFISLAIIVFFLVLMIARIQCVSPSDTNDPGKLDFSNDSIHKTSGS